MFLLRIICAIILVEAVVSDSGPPVMTQMTRRGLRKAMQPRQVRRLAHGGKKGKKYKDPKYCDWEPRPGGHTCTFYLLEWWMPGCALSQSYFESYLNWISKTPVDKAYWGIAPIAEPPSNIKDVEDVQELCCMIYDRSSSPESGMTLYDGYNASYFQTDWCAENYTPQTSSPTATHYYSYGFTNFDSYGFTNFDSYGFTNSDSYGFTNFDSYGFTNFDSYGFTNFDSYGFTNFESYGFTNFDS
ncbi:hypothetical protein TrCOL_g9801 [Triparma columacea]|uniref:Uncharacterized protein n=1 Tax=Triparma columacea TaxID=722753 RepID=A0A9W7GG30_9STRA|nr:hypothetical protein TrCOL_g9801 [Triparma columacea]